MHRLRDCSGCRLQRRISLCSGHTAVSQKYVQVLQHGTLRVRRAREHATHGRELARLLSQPQDYFLQRRTLELRTRSDTARPR